MKRSFFTDHTFSQQTTPLRIHWLATPEGRLRMVWEPTQRSAAHSGLFRWSISARGRTQTAPGS